MAFAVMSLPALAQNEEGQEAYRQFMIYRMATENKPKQLTQTLALLKLSNQLSAKQVTNIHYHLGRMYEDIEQPDSALAHYEISLKGEPNYEVANRAVGFIYLERSAVAAKNTQEAMAAKDAAANAKALGLYKQWVLKALPHLEKYQACAPDEETKTIIINLYKSLKDNQALATLDARLKEMGKKCVDLLDDE